MSLTHSETFLFHTNAGYDNFGQYYCSDFYCTPKWPAPFPSCTLTGTTTDPNKLSLDWTAAESIGYVAEGNLMVVTASGDTVFDLNFVSGVFPPAPSGSIKYTHTTSHLWKYQCSLTLSITLSDPSEPRQGGYAETFAASMVSRIPNDICIHFPRTGQSLWSNESILRKASPYLSSLLTSGFSETEPTSQADSTSPDKVMIDPYEFEDSDEESDKILPSNSASQANDFGKANFKRIDVTQATYTTYANVLCWIGSGHIAFAPLKSTKRFPSASVSTNPPQTPSSLPAPASPKSIYRLAHLLELPDLVDLSLRNFEKQLTTQNVAHELYTDVASTYPQIRDLAMDFAVKHWKEVVKSEAYKEVKKRAETEGIDSLTGMLLMEKLADR